MHNILKIKDLAFNNDFYLAISTVLACDITHFRASNAQYYMLK